MDRGQHGHRQVAPHGAGVLRQIGRAVRASGEAAIAADTGVAAAEARHAAHVEACAKCTPFAGQHHGAHVPRVQQALPRGDQRLEHGRIDGVHLLRPIQADFRHAGLDGEQDAFSHEVVLVQDQR